MPRAVEGRGEDVTAATAPGAREGAGGISRFARDAARVIGVHFVARATTRDDRGARIATTRDDDATRADRDARTTTRDDRGARIATTRDDDATRADRDARTTTRDDRRVMLAAPITRAVARRGNRAGKEIRRKTCKPRGSLIE